MTQTPVLTHSISLVSAQDFWEFKVQLADFVTWQLLRLPARAARLGVSVEKH